MSVESGEVDVMGKAALTKRVFTRGDKNGYPRKIKTIIVNIVFAGVLTQDKEFWSKVKSEVTEVVL